EVPAGACPAVDAQPRPLQARVLGRSPPILAYRLHAGSAAARSPPGHPACEPSQYVSLPDSPEGCGKTGIAARAPPPQGSSDVRACAVACPLMRDEIPGCALR